MFGGAGIYRDGIMFALVSDGEVYLKSGIATSARFEAAGCRPFVYSRRGTSVDMSYWSMPDAALDDSDELKIWAGLAFEAALEAKTRKKGR
jgi:DNA transformation protein and related proteins